MSEIKCRKENKNSHLHGLSKSSTVPWSLVPIPRLNVNRIDLPRNSPLKRFSAPIMFDVFNRSWWSAAQTSRSKKKV